MKVLYDLRRNCMMFIVLQISDKQHGEDPLYKKETSYSQKKKN
ncbi:hypothetical protein [Chryseobacterium sp. POE27]